MDFYYPNRQNDMWRIFGLVFFADQQYFISVDGRGYREALIRDFLSQRGIAISDTAYKIERLKNNAADQFLRIIEPLNLAQLLAQIPQCHTMMTTGEKATDTLCALLSEATRKPTLQQSGQTIFQGRRIDLYRLPSSSRAYPKPLVEKAEAYARFFRDIGML